MALQETNLLPEARLHDTVAAVINQQTIGTCSVECKATKSFRAA